MVTKIKSNNAKATIQSLIVFVCLAIVLIAGFILADTTADIYDDVDAGNWFNFTAQNNYELINVSINMSTTGSDIGANITLLNITFPDSFTVNASSNYTTVDTASNLSIDGNVWTWFNGTFDPSTGGMMLNGSGFNDTFSFNVSASTYGWYNITFEFYNISGLAATSVYQTWVNDTTVPAVTLINPVSGYNYSGNFTLNATITDATITGVVVFNLTDYYSGIENASYNASQHASSGNWNVTLDTMGLSEGQFNITVIANDSQNNLNDSEMASNIIFDNTVPVILNATNVTSPPAKSNYSATTIVLNATAIDELSNLSTIMFNVTNSSGVQNATYSTVRADNTDWWNATLNTAHFPDGMYNLSILAIDTAGNINNSVNILDLTFDRTAPLINMSKSSSSTSTSLTVDIVVTDVTSPIISSCGISDDAVSISGSDRTQTLTQGSLDCGHSYSYTIICTDQVGNSASKTSSFSTSSCGSSGGGGGGSGDGTTWINTIVGDDEDLSEKGDVHQELGSKERIRLKVGRDIHYVGVSAVTTTTASIEVSSSPQKATLSIGDTRKFDLNSDGTYDLSVTLNAIVNGKANFVITSINEEITGESEEEQEEAQQQAEEEAGIQEARGRLLLWIVIIVIVVIVIAIGTGWGVKKKSSNKKKK